VLLGSFSAGALAATASAAEGRVTPESYYINDHYIPGVGYYHAPFHAFYPQPYNFYDVALKMYFYGGRWSETRHQSIINISTPPPEVARAAEAMRTDLRQGTTGGYVHRSGFGSTGGSNTIRS
jgi:hypothetical protein